MWYSSDVTVAKPPTSKVGAYLPTLIGFCRGERELATLLLVLRRSDWYIIRFPVIRHLFRSTHLNICKAQSNMKTYKKLCIKEFALNLLHDGSCPGTTCRSRSSSIIKCVEDIDTAIADYHDQPHSIGERAPSVGSQLASLAQHLLPKPRLLVLIAQQYRNNSNDKGMP